MVKIRLKEDIPVEKKYGLKAGKVLYAEKVSSPGRGNTYYRVTVLEDVVKLWPHEVEVITND